MTLDLKTFPRKVHVTDGVYGTELQAKGLLIPPSWKSECEERDAG